MHSSGCNRTMSPASTSTASPSFPRRCRCGRGRCCTTACGWRTSRRRRPHPRSCCAASWSCASTARRRRPRAAAAPRTRSVGTASTCRCRGRAPTTPSCRRGASGSRCRVLASASEPAASAARMLRAVSVPSPVSCRWSCVIQRLVSQCWSDMYAHCHCIVHYADPLRDMQSCWSSVSSSLDDATTGRRYWRPAIPPGAASRVSWRCSCCGACSAGTLLQGRLRVTRSVTLSLLST